jgi:hypothetical protein
MQRGVPVTVQYVCEHARPVTANVWRDRRMPFKLYVRALEAC